MTEILHTLHWGLRYVVLLAGLGVLVVGSMQWSRTDADSMRVQRIAMASFVGTMHLQVLLGVLLLVFWVYYPALIGHIMMMVMGAVVAQVGAMTARRREPARAGAPIRVVAALVTLFLIVGGIMAIQRPVI